MKFGILFDDRKIKAKELASKTKTWLGNKNHEISENVINDNLDFMITFGGDGFILSTANTIASKELSIPIIRVNLGCIGALANIEPNEIFEQLQQFLNDNYIIKKRTRISARVYSDRTPKILLQEIDGLNEIVIERTQTRAISFMINHNKKSGDGVIIATQTGSTAYNHTAGGRVLIKDEMVATIISSGSSESSLVKSTSFIFEINGIKEKARLVVDGNKIMNLSKDNLLLITKSKKITYFVEIGDITK